MVAGGDLVEALVCQHGDVVLGLDPAEVGADDGPAPHESNDGMLMGAALPSTPRTTVFPQPWTIPAETRRSVGHLHRIDSAAQDSDTNGC